MALQDTHSKESLKLELSSLREELLSTRKDLTELRHKHMGCGHLIETLKTEVKTLQKERSEKTSEIYKLQRENTVQIWQKEKERFLTEANERIKNLETEVSALQSEKATLQERIKHYEEKFKTEKLKNEKMRNDPTFSNIDLETFKDQKQQEQQIFLLEQDMQRLKSELNKWHKSSLGLLHGLCTDYDNYFSSLLHYPMQESVSVDRNTMRRARLLQSIMHKCRDHAKAGTISMLQAELPEYYIALDTDIFYVKSASGAGRPKTQPSRHVAGHNGVAPRSNEAFVTEKKSESDSDASSDDSEDKFTLGTGSTKKPVVIHPVLVDPKTDLPDSIMIMKHFPHLPKEFVMEHYNHFKEYDQNHDNHLDLVELVTAMTKTMGERFTPLQIEDAINEVDTDGDSELDFYEYMKVVDMMLHMTDGGHCEVFRGAFMKQHGKTLAQTCVVM